jgi:hypothetical protein
MAERLIKDIALALLGSTIAAGAVLVVLFGTLDQLQGRTSIPAVTLVFRERNEATW